MSLNIQILDAGDSIGLKINNKIDYYEKDLVEVYSNASGLVGLRPKQDTTLAPIVEAHPTEYLQPKEASVRDLVEQIKAILTTVPNNDLTLAQLQAIQNANNPSSSNVFVTFLDMIASLIGFTPNGDISSTNVQDAIVELRDDSDNKLNLKQDLSDKGQPNGYASLDATGKVPSSQIPSSASGVNSVNGDGVDNTDPQNPVLSFPNADQVDDTSTSNKFINTSEKNLISTSIQPGDNVSELTNDAGYISDISGQNHSELNLDDGTNPHGTTKSDIGLSNADNTSDADKPISTLTQVALNNKKDNFSENTAFNKNFGTNAGEVLEGNTRTITPSEISTIGDQSGINTGDETDASIKTKYENNPDTNPFTDAEKSKLASVESSKFVGEFTSLASLQSAYPTAPVGSYAYVDTGVGQPVEKYIWDNNDSQWELQQGQSTAETPATIKTKYESNPDTNAFTDSEKTNLNNQSGTNTGDETTVGIQSKRPLKTVDGQTLEGSGDIPFPVGGDMFKNVYDTKDEGIVDKSQSISYKAQLNQSVVKGNLVYAVDRNLVTGNPIVGLADNTVNFADKPVGIALSNGSSGSVIEVLKSGIIENIDTSLFSVGETVYLSTNGTFNSLSNITTGIFNPIGYIVKSNFTQGVIIIDTNATETINSDNTINSSNVTGRTISDALETLNNSLGGVETVTGDGVDNTDPENPVLSFPNADEVDDTTTTNKFATQAQLEDIASNTQGVSDNAQEITDIGVALTDLFTNKRDITAQKNSVESDSGDLQLVGDETSPGNNKNYGTDENGAKGFKNDVRYSKVVVAVDAALNNFNSTVLTDIPGVSLNIDRDGDYTFYFAINVNGDQNEEIDFTISLIPITNRTITPPNGIPVFVGAGTQFTSDFQALRDRVQKNSDQSLQGTFLFDALEDGDEIRFRMNTRGDNVDLTNRRAYGYTINNND